jgi:hypothetical protein
VRLGRASGLGGGVPQAVHQLVNVLLERFALAFLSLERFSQLLSSLPDLLEPGTQLTVDHLGVMALSLALNGELRKFPLCGLRPLAHECQLLTQIVALHLGFRPALSRGL